MAAEYIITLGDITQIPDLFKKGFLLGRSQPRIAFVGRSNVGKSSLINALLKERIARVSATPGKTRALHFFLWKDTDKIVVDLPGYGFAKVAKGEKNTWSALMNAYFKADSALEVVFILFDSRHGPTDQDLEALEFFGELGVPVQIVMTKIDQLKTQSDRARRKKEVLALLEPFDVADAQIVWLSVNEERTLENLRRMLT